MAEEKHHELSEELKKALPPITPWDVRDALHLHHDRINKLGEFFVTLKQDLQEVSSHILTVTNRINNGVSPSVNEVKGSLHEMKELMIKLESKMDLLFSDVDKRISVTDKYIETEFERFNKLVDEARGFAWKLVFTAVVAFVTMIFGVTFYVNTLKQTLILPQIQLENQKVIRKK